jgi:signal transduction histidine kinase
VSHYLAQLGGQMRLESQEGAGTTVQISLPLELPA